MRPGWTAAIVLTLGCRNRDRGGRLFSASEECTNAATHVVRCGCQRRRKRLQREQTRAGIDIGIGTALRCHNKAKAAKDCKRKTEEALHSECFLVAGSRAPLFEGIGAEDAALQRLFHTQPVT